MRPLAAFALPWALRWKRRGIAAVLDRATAEPERYQREVLLRILRTNADTTYGRQHGFGSIRNVEDFRRAVPVNSYEDLRPWVARIADGSDPHALTADPVEMFTNTSGTTAEPKLIPVTASGRRAERRVKDAWFAHLAADHPGIWRGKWFFLFNAAEEYRTPGGHWVGSNAGLLYRNTNRVLRSLGAVPYEICLIDHYESRYYVMLRYLLATHLTLLMCVNPSSLLLLAELANQNAASLIEDIGAGGLRDGLELTPEQYAFFRAQLSPRPRRARELTALLEEDGRLLPTRYWPDLPVLGSWKGPGLATFIEKCKEWYGDLPIRDLGYSSSEFRTGLVLTNEGSPNIPLPDNYFYEFVPIEEHAAEGSAERRTMDLHELELGRRYVIVQTGPHGLYRYDIDDIVEVDGFYRRTPTIHFVQKAKMVTSITGEKLYETQVIEAVERATRERPDLRPSFFMCYADEDASNYKLCVEFDEPRDRESLAELLALFEEALGEVNIEYPYKRASMRLRHPEIFLLSRGSSVKLIQHIGKRATMDNQAKILRLSRAVDEHFALFGLERTRAHGR